MGNNRCVDCGVKIGIRAKRCPPCRRVYRTQYEADRVAVQRAQRPEPAPGYGEEDERIVDYSKGGHKAPSFDYHQPAPRPPHITDEVSDGRVENPATRKPSTHLDMSRIPGWVRRDTVRAQRMAATMARQEQTDAGLTWDQSLQAIQDDLDHGASMVEFRAPDTSPPAGYDQLGRPYPRTRRWP
jgi:hypothetical protein